MPPALIAVLPAIIAAAGTAATLGVELTNQPGATPPISKAPVPQSAATNQAQTAAVSNTLPTLQSLTGGSLSPEYAAQWGADQAGLNNNPQAAQNIQAAINQYFGLGAPGQTGLTPTGGTGGNSITDLLSRLPSPGTSAPGGGSLVDGLLNQNFSGFSQ